MAVLSFKDEIDSGDLKWDNHQYFEAWEKRIASVLGNTESVTEDGYEGDEIGMEDRRESLVCIKFTKKYKTKTNAQLEQNIDTQRKKLNKRHRKKFFSKITRKCDSCEFKTNGLKTYERHNFEDHGRTFCGDCGMNFNEFEDYFKHSWTHRDPVKCPYCPMEFTTDVKLDYHVNYKHFEAQHKKVCPYCGKRFVDLNHHIRVVHDRSVPQIQCPHCEFSSDAGAVKMHIRRRHTGKTGVNCPWCGKFVKDLNLHLARNQCNIPEDERTLERPATCEICKKTVRNDEALRKHMANMHTNVKSFQCDQCNFNTKHAFNLRAHVKRLHEGKPLKEICPKCKKSCINLQWHLDTFHTENVHEINTLPSCTLK